MKSILSLLILTFSFSSMALELTPACKSKVLKSLRARDIMTSSAVNRDTSGNLAPFVGAVCKDESAFKVNSVNANRLVITAIVNPWDPTHLRADCTEVPLNRYPVNVVQVDKNNNGNCELTLIGVQSEFSLDD